MPLPTRTQNTLLVILAVVAVSASSFAVWSVGRPVATAPAPSTAQEASTATHATVDEDPAPQSATPERDEDEPSETATASPVPSDPSVATWVEAWSGEANLLVVGDGFSNLPSQWVQLWADRVGRDRPVTIHHWGEAADVSFNDAIVLSEADGPELTVWSGSRDGSTIHDAAEHYPRFVDASVEPDAVLVSMGLSSGNEDIADGLDELVGEIDDDIPVLITIGPDGLYEDGVGDALLEWSQQHDDRVAVVDLRDEAPIQASAEQWAVAFADALDRS